MTTNPLPTHSIHAVSPPPRNIHHIGLIEGDSIHILSWDDGLLEPIILHNSCEVDGVSLVFRFLHHLVLSQMGHCSSWLILHLWLSDTRIPLSRSLYG